MKNLHLHMEKEYGRENVLELQKLGAASEKDNGFLEPEKVYLEVLK